MAGEKWAAGQCVAMAVKALLESGCHYPWLAILRNNWQPQPGHKIELKKESLLIKLDFALYILFTDNDFMN
ncbi:hypothetical protein ACFQT0_07055 [Hymenobacter humi]|uniref:Uncharacterized protein n=1 Tax=Hymenobacter humi TaxID=1411620 RepID=A0ABW2U2X9_9BACT